MYQTPVVRGMFVCERTIIEEGTRNLTIVNTFDTRRVQRFPEELTFAVGAMLVNGAGIVPVTVTLARLDIDKEIYERTFPLKFESKLDAFRFALSLRFTFVRAGMYEVELRVAGNVLAATRFEVKLFGE